MEIQVLLESAISKIKNYENNSSEKIEEYKENIRTKDKLIRSQDEIISKLRCEMDDFLKVSFANKWKKEAEDYKRRFIELHSKYESLNATNKTLNSTLDSMTKENISIETQTPNINIVTKNKDYYIENGLLITKNENKTIGTITNIQ